MATKLKIRFSLLLFFYISAFYSCNPQKKDNSNNNDSNVQSQVIQMKEKNMKTDSNCIIINDISFDGKDAFLTFIEKERTVFYDARRNRNYEEMYTDRSISFVFPIFSYWLNTKMYQPVSDSIFKDRMNLIFGIDVSTQKGYEDTHKNYFEYYTYQAYEALGGIITEGVFLFSLKYNLFFRAQFNGSIVKEIGGNQQYQSCFSEKLYHYNNYIFNDSQASLTWLINNDIEFLELLVREFGYDKNEKINKVVLRYIFRNFEMFDGTPNYSQFNDVFFKKDSQGKLSIRKGLLKTLEDETNSKNLMYIYGLINYFFDFWEYSKEKAKYSEKEISEIFVNIAVVEERMRSAYYKPATPEWNNRSDAYYVSIEYPKLFEIAENNNYFDIPFDAVLEMVQVDGEPI